MEARKKCSPFLVILAVFVGILLAISCWIAAGATSFLPSGLRYGVRIVTDNTKTKALADGDFVLINRDTSVAAGDVVYVPDADDGMYIAISSFNGDQVVLADGSAVDKTVYLVRYKLTFLSAPVRFLRDFPWVAYGLTGAFAAVWIVMAATAGARDRKRQQKLMRESFVRYGEQYAREEEDVNY